MDQQTRAPGLSGGGTRALERYADPSRPPQPWVYAVAAVLLGVAIALSGILPAAWAVVLVALVAAAGTGYDRWLLLHHGLPRLRDLPGAVWREQLALILLALVVGGLPPLLASFVATFSHTAGMATAGIAVAILLGVGGPIVDRRARSTAGELLEGRPSSGPDRGRP